MLVDAFVTVVDASVEIELTGVILLGRFLDAPKKKCNVDCCFGVWYVAPSSFSSKIQIPVGGVLLVDVNTKGLFV